MPLLDEIVRVVRTQQTGLMWCHMRTESMGYRGGASMTSRTFDVVYLKPFLRRTTSS